MSICYINVETIEKCKNVIKKQFGKKKYTSSADEFLLHRYCISYRKIKKNFTNHFFGKNVHKLLSFYKIQKCIFFYKFEKNVEVKLMILYYINVETIGKHEQYKNKFI